MIERCAQLLFDDCRGRGPGALVGVAQRGQVLYRGAFGLANVEHGVPTTFATRVPIASVTKHFACALALQLEAQGRLSLADHIGRWIPELRDLQARPTLRQLMTHTGGLRCFLDLAVFNGIRTVPANYPLAAQARQEGVNFDPGAGFLYSNGGYYLLSLALERASDRPFADLIADLCREVGMGATSAPRHPWPLESNIATQYMPCEGGWRVAPPMLEEHLGDGSMVSCVDDLLAWLAYLRSGKGQVSLETLTQPTRLLNGYDSAYGLGLTTEQWRGVRLVHHAGLLLGASCMLVTVPDHELDLFVACNRPVPVRGIALAFLDVMLAGELQPAREPPRTHNHAALLGRYLAADGSAFAEFADVRGELGFSLFGAPAGPLVSRDSSSAGTSRLELPSYAGPAELIVGDADSTFDLVDAGTVRRFRRLPGLEVSPAEVFHGIEGEFESREAGVRLWMTLEPCGIRVHTRGDYGQCVFVADALAPDVLRLTPVGYDVGWLARLSRSGGRVDAVTLSSVRTRGVRLERVGRG